MFLKLKIKQLPWLDIDTAYRSPILTGEIITGYKTPSNFIWIPGKRNITAYLFTSGIYRAPSILYNVLHILYICSFGNLHVYGPFRNICTKQNGDVFNTNFTRCILFIHISHCPQGAYNLISISHAQTRANRNAKN